MNSKDHAVEGVERTTRGPEMEPLLQFFSFEHLPENLKQVSEPFSRLAGRLVTMVPRNPERTVALRKLLEAKDCAVRAALWKEPEHAADRQGRQD